MFTFQVHQHARFEALGERGRTRQELEHEASKPSSATGWRGEARCGSRCMEALVWTKLMGVREGIRVSKKASRREGRWQRMDCAETHRRARIKWKRAVSTQTQS